MRLIHVEGVGLAKAPRAVSPPLLYCGYIIALSKPRQLHQPFLTHSEHMQVCTLGRKGRTESKMQKCVFPAEARKDFE